MPVRSFDPKHQKTPFGSIVRIERSVRWQRWLLMLPILRVLQLLPFKYRSQQSQGSNRHFLRAVFDIYCF
jgi:hypothetical protein